ncbi:TPA: hypothetical protein RD852_000724 [Listeria monocytogenes]|uniref:hypothetical protein n=1 Tax=Listeria TaxID=1637 RepID=UPI000BDEF755|nr:MULTISPECIES: hypothetical protein [Listeria]EAC5079592.1 hypothetical protein [Listeria monocytogenes]EAC6159076.1 hypothetical protein [Listeria monocytogenes]EAC7675210.1 hypothetical protein [Listeria monocytogenes]EAC7684167.1 hypothetical protein [Listeria monocytogenes]EAC7838745.1 hypothetical protein [Listeria monocytogenes]
MKNKTIILSVIVYLLGIILMFLTLFKVIPYCYEVKGFDKVLESVINFSAIIIGFYSAMYGVLLTLKNSDIFKKFKFYGAEGTVKFQLYEALICSFFVLVSSILMQVLENYINIVTNIVSSIWIGAILILIFSTFRSISLLLRIMFNNNEVNKVKSDETKDNEKREEILKDFNK